MRKSYFQILREAQESAFQSSQTPLGKETPGNFSNFSTINPDRPVIIQGKNNFDEQAIKYYNE